jgi:hypothetical protein
VVPAPPQWQKKSCLQKPETYAAILPIRRIRGVARRWGREIVRDRSFETFCTQLETRVDFFYFFARNPLKSPDSDE